MTAENRGRARRPRALGAARVRGRRGAHVRSIVWVCYGPRYGWPLAGCSGARICEVMAGFDGDIGVGRWGAREARDENVVRVEVCGDGSPGFGQDDIHIIWLDMMKVQ